VCWLFKNKFNILVLVLHGSVAHCVVIWRISNKVDRIS